MSKPLEFELPPELEAHDPPEAFGRARDDVRMMVAFRQDGRLFHMRFRDLPTFLERGDLLVINTSRTLAASIPARRNDGTRLDLHLSTPILDDARSWVIEVRLPPEDGGRSFRKLNPGEKLALPNGFAEVLTAYPPEGVLKESRLWVAALHLPSPLDSYLEIHGRPIRYGSSSREWPASYYQNVYAIEPGSVEMPSAGRPFTPQMLTTLIVGGVDIAPITLHAGVSSLEDHEPPLTEYYRVSDETAHRVALTKQLGGRVIAVGTTVVRALETATDGGGTIHADEGWTNLFITPKRPIRTVDGLITGWHEPRASHLLMLEAIAGRQLLESSYRAALECRYRWHEFGDLYLLLP